KELDGVARAFEAKMMGQIKQARGTVEVVLTPEQRARILKETGVSMNSVIINDPSGGMNTAMPSMTPPDVYPEALKQAKEQAAAGKAREQAYRDVEATLRDLESQHELNAEAVARLREDPQFKEMINFGITGKRTG